MVNSYKYKEKRRMNMKRRLTGEIKVIGYYPVAGMTALYVLPFEVVSDWEYRKGNDAIALLWNGKVCFRQIYYRNNGGCFKFFNKWIYLSELVRTEGYALIC